MTKITKLLLVAGVGLAAWYIPTILAVMNMELKIISVIPTNITGSKISALVTVKLKNNSGSKIDVQSILADIMLNGLKIAQISQVEAFPILAHSEQNFNVNFIIDAEVVGTQLFAQLLAQNLQNCVLEVKGYLTANSKKLPFDTYWTIKDFV